MTGSSAQDVSRGGAARKTPNSTIQYLVTHETTAGTPEEQEAARRRFLRHVYSETTRRWTR